MKTAHMKRTASCGRLVLEAFPFRSWNRPQHQEEPDDGGKLKLQERIAAKSCRTEKK